MLDHTINIYIYNIYIYILCVCVYEIGWWAWGWTCHPCLPACLPQAPPRLLRPQHTNGQCAEITSGSLSFPLGLYLAIILLLPLASPSSSSASSLSSIPSSSFNPSSWHSLPPSFLYSALPWSSTILNSSSSFILRILLHIPILPSSSFTIILHAPYFIHPPLNFITILLLFIIFFRPNPPPVPPSSAFLLLPPPTSLNPGTGNAMPITCLEHTDPAEVSDNRQNGRQHPSPPPSYTDFSI